jgi:hypothetical protein
MSEKMSDRDMADGPHSPAFQVEDYWSKAYHIADAMRRHLAATPVQKDDAYSAYWNGWNDACDAIAQMSWWRRAIAELKRPRL